MSCNAEGVENLSLSFKDETKGRRSLVVYDCRFEKKVATERRLDTSGLDLDGCLQVVSKARQSWFIITSLTLANVQRKQLSTN